MNNLNINQRSFTTFGFLLFVLLVCFVPGSISAQSKQTPNITLKMKDAIVSDALETITKLYDITFIMPTSGINTNARVSIDVTEQPLKSVLEKIFAEQQVDFEIDGRLVRISKTPVRAAVQQSNQRMVSGTVKDSSGNPVSGVTVVVKGTYTVGITDNNGKYSLRVDGDNAVLEFSNPGYTTVQETAGKRSVIDVVMNEEFKIVDEVIVVGYGTQKKVNLTGAVSQITAEDMKDRPVTKMTQALQGMIPNLNITFGSGQPGTSGTLNIRGTTSINGGTPLVLIDGIPGNIDRINVNDVATISVLKDASASAVYGAQAAFGVILITTKTPKTGKVQVSYHNNFAWTTHATSTDFITDGYTNAKINDDAFYAYNASHLFQYTDEDWNEMKIRIGDKTENPDRPWVVVKQAANGKDRYNYYGNFDWFNYFYSQYRPKQSHDLSITGSTGGIRYLVSGNYAREQGIFKIAPDVENRFNFRAKLDSDITKWLTISSNTRYFRSKYDWVGYNQFYTPSSDNLIGSSDPQFYVPYYHYHPQYVPFNPDGTLTGNSEMSNYTMGFGLHAIQENGKSKGEQSSSEFSTTFQAVFKIMDWMTVTGNYTYTQYMFQRWYRSTKIQYSVYPGEMQNWSWAALNTDQLTERLYTDDTHVINIYANFDRQFGKHSLKAMAGFNQEYLYYKNIQASATDLLSEDLTDLKLASGETPRVSGQQIEYALRGAFARLNYDYDNKYLFEFSGRYDGTSRFPKASRFIFNPSFSAGWRISEENFFKPISNVVNNLKIRYSYGTLGNQKLDGQYYPYIMTMSTAMSSSWLQNGNLTQITTMPQPVASYLTWESATTNNIGLDLDMFGNRLGFVLDLYTRDTKNMLAPGKTLPGVYGAGEPQENSADLRTKGYEITLNWRDRFNLGGKPFQYSVTAIFADAVSHITRYDNPTGLLSDFREGQQLGEIWGYVYDGFFATDEEAQEYTSRINVRGVQGRGNYITGLGAYAAGDIRILDLNGDNVINGGAGTVDSPGDKVLIGNSTPRYSYGLSLSASWNGIDIYAMFQGIGRKDWYPNSEATMFWGPFSRPYSSFIPSGFMDDVWSPDNTDAYFPRLVGYIAAGHELANPNTMYLQNVGYCKLRNLTVGYTFPERWMGKAGISKLRIYASGENLLTWSKLKSDYIDPEETMVYSSARTYPMGKTYSFGVELSF